MVELDTSGVVMIEFAPGCDQLVTWERLAPFTQGYVEALFADGIRDGYEETAESATPRHVLAGRVLHLGFSDLAPATLQRIMEDCEAYKERFTATTQRTEMFGAHFESRRRRGLYTDFGFPPQTLILAEDGLIYARETAGRQAIAHATGGGE